MIDFNVIPTLIVLFVRMVLYKTQPSMPGQGELKVNYPIPG